MEAKDPTVIYLDADTEITEAIEKLKKASGQEVRLVAPARSNIFQSAVNLKLLKKASAEGKKELVLVGNDKTTLGLAGLVGVAVAKNVKAEAEVPEAPEKPPIDESPAEITGPESTGDEPATAATTGLGDVAKSTTNKPSAQKSDRTVQAPPSGKKVRVPNYGGLNKKIALIVGGVIALILLILAFIFLPTGKVIVTAKAQRQQLNFRFSADASTSKSDYEAGVVAAKKLETTKDYSASYQATGKKDAGAKASGSIAVRNCEDTHPHSLPAGSTLSSSGKNFTTNSAVTIPAGEFVEGGASCASDSVSVSATAAENGDSYNLANATFVVAGMSSRISGKGSTSGGSSRTVTVVTAKDIESAKSTTIETNAAQAKSDLLDKNSDSYTLFESSYKTDVLSAVPSAPEGAEASSGTISLKVRYSVFAVNKKDLQALFESQMKKEIPGGTQVYQSGVDDAKYTEIKELSPEKLQVQATSTGYYGNQIDTAAIAKQSAGKGKKEVADKVKAENSQITEASVETSPALMPIMPFIGSRIKVEIKVDTSE